MSFFRRPLRASEMKDGVLYAVKRTGPCPRCHYIGNRHLCACIGRIGDAIHSGDMDRAGRLYDALVEAANDEERNRIVWPA